MSYICIIVGVDSNESDTPTIYPVEKVVTLEEGITHCKKAMYEEYINLLNTFEGADLDYIEDRFLFVAKVISLDTMETAWFN